MGLTDVLDCGFCVEAAGAASSGTLYLDLDTVANATASVDDDDDLSSEDQYLAHAELYEQEDKDSLDSVDGDLVLDLDAVVDEQGHTMSTEDDLGLE